MSFILRRPFTVAAGLKKLTKSSPTVCLFHDSRLRSNSFINPRSTTLTTSNTAKSKFSFQNAFKRAYTPAGSYQAVQQPTGNLTQRLLVGGAMVGGAILATNLIFNRETREDGGMPPFEREYLNQTFLHTGLGVGIIATAATAMHRSGWSYRLMATNPWLVVGLGLAMSFGTMYATYNTHPDNYLQKYGLWTAFNVTQAAILSPLMFMSPAILARAGLYTVGMMGSIAFVGATAKQEKYLYLGGPLLAGVAIVAISGFAPLVLPATAARTLMWTENIWLYGGLAVFGGFTLYDVQKILQHARMSERGLVRKDVVNESISLELDFLNIFIRMVQILGMRGGNNRK